MTEETSKRAEIERLARKMCKVATNLDPDHLYITGELPRIREGYAVTLGDLRPLWLSFLAEAIVAYEEIEQFRVEGPEPESVSASEPFDFPDQPSDEDVKAARSWREKQGLA